MKNKQLIIINMLTPKESNVYRKMKSVPIYDSFGVERGNDYSICYTHAIPLGLVSSTCF